MNKSVFQLTHGLDIQRSNGMEWNQFDLIISNMEYLVILFILIDYSLYLPEDCDADHLNVTK